MISHILESESDKLSFYRREQTRYNMLSAHKSFQLHIQSSWENYFWWTFEPVRHHRFDNQFSFGKKQSETLRLLLVLGTINKKFDYDAVKDLSCILTLRKLLTSYHITLIQKLHKIGIRGKLIELILPYLTNRKEYVKINNEEFGLLEIINGVPHGSILGPLFFIIFTNNLPEQLTDVFFLVLLMIWN